MKVSITTVDNGYIVKGFSMRFAVKSVEVFYENLEEAIKATTKFLKQSTLEEEKAEHNV